MPEDKKAEPRFPDNIPVVPPKPGDARPDYKDYKGKYTRLSDGEVYALAVVEDAPDGRTHKAINTVHSWEGTERQFLIEFTEVGKEGQPKNIPNLEGDFAAREKFRKEQEGKSSKKK